MWCREYLYEQWFYMLENIANDLLSICLCDRTISHRHLLEVIYAQENQPVLVLDTSKSPLLPISIQLLTMLDFLATEI